MMIPVESYFEVRFAVFGCCNTLYEDNGNCNVAGRNLYENLTKIGAKPLSPLGVGDANIQRVDSKTATQETDFKKWVDKLMPFLENAVNDPTYFPNPSAFKTKRKRRKVAPVSDTSGDHDLLDIESLGAMVGAGSKKQKTEDDDEVRLSALFFFGRGTGQIEQLKSLQYRCP